MKLLDALVGVIAPHICVGCEVEGHTICSSCVNVLPQVPARCYRCYRLTERSKTCVACRKLSALYRLQVGTTYDGHAKEVIAWLKFTGAQQAANDIAIMLAERVKLEPGSLIVPVPTATSRVRQRGFDQAKLIAKFLSKETRSGYFDCLARSGQTRQRGARRQQRLAQLSAAFRLKSGYSVQGKHIVLIDDVVTTGATLEAASRYLRQAGADRVEAVVFAQA